MKRKCVFLDRDGVINEDDVNHVYEVAHYHILPGVKEALLALHKAGYLLVVVTNQSGIDKGVYTHEHVAACHAYLQSQIENVIDAFYYSPYHPSFTESLSRKPDTLMFEKAIAKFDIDPSISWMVGDKQRDLTPAHGLGITTISVGFLEQGIKAAHKAENLLAASRIILSRPEILL